MLKFLARIFTRPPSLSEWIIANYALITCDMVAKGHAPPCCYDEVCDYFMISRELREKARLDGVEGV